MDASLKHGSFFSGIGGFDLAAQRMGFENVFQVEIDKFAQKVLKKNFPDTTRYLEIKDFVKNDAAKYQGSIDIISGGFPCQPFSLSGPRTGSSDNRFLWPQMLEGIRIIQPTWVIAENVIGIHSMEEGAVFEQICLGLESSGYAVQAFDIPAAAVEAQHERRRIWFVAYSPGKRCRQVIFPSGNRKETTKKASRIPTGTTKKPWLQWDVEPLISGKSHGIPHRLDRCRALGNAIHPGVAYNLFQWIKEVEHANSNSIR